MGAENSEDELTPEELAEEANGKIDALINLLVKKGVISEHELDEEIETLFGEEEEESPGLIE